MFVTAAGAAYAHRAAVPVSEIKWNPRSDVWEVTHLVSAHDLEPVMWERGVPPDGLFETPEGQLEIGRYILERFRLVGAASSIELSYRGAERDLDQVWIYFELKSDNQDIMIDSDILTDDTEPDVERPYALVNLHTASGIESLVFGALDGAKPARLEQ